MKITLIQPRQNKLYDFAHPENRFTRDQSLGLSRAMTAQTLALMEQSAPADLVVTSEAVNFPGLATQLPSNWTELVTDDAALYADFARRHHTWVVADLYTREQGHRWNTAIVFDRQGNEVTRYHKTHLAGSEQDMLTPGEGFCTVEADFGRFGVCICWDMQFPEVCRHYALEGTRLVVCPTWGWERIYTHARAYENGIFVAGAMSVPYRGRIAGIRQPSSVIAPDGSLVAQADRNRAMTLTCDIDLNAMQNLYRVRMHDRRPDLYHDLTEE